MHLGAAWYPEHWPEERWAEDVRLMREAGMNVCRIAEFAWSTLEPTEGYYALDWLERAVALLHENGLAVVLGTPTAAPPAWLTHHHPDTLAIDTSGKPVSHGNRCHHAPSNPTFHKCVRRIVEQMGKRFGQDERVIGWQIDNEYNRVDYSDHTRRLFQHYLRELYGSLDALNEHWSTAYWSQTYTGWEEIPLPIGPHNPGLMLAFKRFVTKVWRDFQKLQIDELRRFIRPEQWITHNFMGWFDAFDHYEVTADLDFATWDWYVGTGHHDYTRSGIIHDLTRGFKRKNFWVMETQPGCVNWSGINTMLDKGEARCMAWHAIAHGADAILYWQWRSAFGGQEQLHGSLIATDGLPRPFYAEIQQLGRDFQAAGDALTGTAPKNEIALLYSYDSRWSVAAQPHHQDFTVAGLAQNYYTPLIKRNLGVDMISAEASLECYRLVIAPALTVLTETTVQNLTAFVEAGGTLVLTVRCGQKDIHNALFPARQPGPLRELAGVEVEEYYALQDPAPVRGKWSSPMAGESRMWAELLRPLAETTQTIATYGESNGWLDGGIAATLHPVGNRGGQVITVGAVLNEALQDSLTDYLLERAGIASPQKTPSGVEIAERVGAEGQRIRFVINHNKMATSLPLPSPLTDLLTGETFTGTLPLPPYGVRVFAV